jgi:hypothetical protein
LLIVFEENQRANEKDDRKCTEADMKHFFEHGLPKLLCL